MTQMLYTDNCLRYNVTYEILGKRSFYINKNYGDMSGYTVILITDDMAENTFIRNIADFILTRALNELMLRLFRLMSDLDMKAIRLMIRVGRTAF